MNKIQSTCNYCALDCNIDFYVEDNTIMKVVPTPEYPVNDGFSCIKGINLDKQQTVIKNSQLPKIKQEDGTLKDVSWDEAYTYVAKKIKDLQNKYGEESFAGISTGQLTMEEFAILGHVMRNYLKTNLDGNTRLCMATAVVAYKQSFGFDAPGYTLNDIELSDTIIFIGANPVVAHPILWDRVRKNKNKKIITIDPRRSETAKNSDYWYGIKPKADVVLLYTVANLLIEKNYIDLEFVEKNTNKFEEFKKFVEKYKLDDIEEKTNLSKEDVVELCELIHKGEGVSIWWTMGVNQGYDAVRTAQAVINICLMTGNIGKEGTGPNSLTGQCNAMGSRLFSNTTGLYGGGDYSDSKRRNEVAKILEISEDVLAEKPTIPYHKIVEGINDGTIKGLWVLCTNPRHSFANNETFKESMDKLELLIVQDIYTTTETAEGADIMLPVVPGIKKDGTYINTERRLSAMRKCVDRNENEKSDFEVIYGIGEALGMGELLKGWETPESTFNLMKKCSEGMPPDITGVNWEDLENSKGVQWPFKNGDTLTSNQRRLFEDGKFYTENKKANFIFDEPIADPIPTSEKYPYILNTGRGTVGQWHTQTRTKEISFVDDAMPKEATVFINSELAKKHNIKNNDVINIESINGQNANFIALISDDLKYDELFSPMHYVECNKLTPSVYDPYSKEPSYKTTPINIRRA
ncbi:MAG: molybdopterin oxidoreductase family protein [Lachnospirales bacterium]